MRQIDDWRVWLGHNQLYARSPQAESGLGLKDISRNIPAWIIIGR
jgi:hypothetical protein